MRLASKAEFFRGLWVSVFLMILCGCQSLPPIGVGNEADSKTMATVKGIVSIAGLNLGYHGVTRFDITAVDSQRRGFFSTSKVMLTPGPHTIEVTTESMAASGMTCYLSFNAQVSVGIQNRPLMGM